MSSKIESAARTLATLIEQKAVTDLDLSIFLKSIKDCDEDTDGKKAAFREAAKTIYHEEG
jgi:hypothetical protein